MDYDLTNEEDIKQYLQNIETEYTYQCFSEKEPDGCHRLADFVNSIKQDTKLGSKLFKDNCDQYKYGHSCFKYAGNRFYGKGVEKNPMEGVTYFEKACENGFPRGCANAGLLLINNNESIPKDIPKGLALLTKACEQDRGEACAMLGTAHLMGNYSLAKDAEKALQLLTKGCELGSLQGCTNASRMYKTGDGVKRNDALSEKYRKKAVEIKQSRDGTGGKQGVSLGRT